jgi:hypothetical protein
MKYADTDLNQKYTIKSTLKHPRKTSTAEENEAELFPEKRGRKNKNWLLERKNKNLGLSQNEDEDSQSDIILPIEQITSDFTSRDMARLYITLTKARTSHDYSLKSIKYWEELSNNPKYKKIFKRYKPWTVHTNYKRIFTYVTIEEAIQILKENSEADVGYLLKLSRSRKALKKDLAEELTKQKPKFHDISVFIDKLGCSNKQEEEKANAEPKLAETVKKDIPSILNKPAFISEINIDNLNSARSKKSVLFKPLPAPFLGKKRRRFRIIKNSAMSKYSIHSLKSVLNGPTVSAFNPTTIDIRPISELQSFFNSFTNKEFGKLFRNIEDRRDYRITENKLSDLYDAYNSSNNGPSNFNNIDPEKIVYMKVGEVRKFYNPYIKNDKKTELLINLNKIKQDYSHFSESFIMESLMRVSNDIDDLKLFLSDTVKNIGIAILIFRYNLDGN